MQHKDLSEAQEIKEILKDKKVQEAVKQSSGNKEEMKKEGSSAMGIMAIIFIVCCTLYILFHYRVIPVPLKYIPLVQRIMVALMFASIILVINRLLKRIFNKKIEDRSTLYNLKNIINLFSIVFICIIALSLVFANWYATMVSFGIGSLILGLALQNTFTSFFGWIYLLIRKPYEVGDRIKIGNAYGDVIRLGYLETTLWEFGGDYLSGDHPSGRIIKFTNSKVFTDYIYNYSWPLFPFIWKELNLFVSYKSDLMFISDTIKKIAEEEMGEAIARRVKRYKKILANTLVEELEVRERPSVMLKAHENLCIEVTVRYLVNPKTSGQVKTALFQKILLELKKYPEKVSFPD